MSDDVPGPAAAELLASPHLTRLDDFRCFGVGRDPASVLAVRPVGPVRRLALAQVFVAIGQGRGRIGPADVERSPLLRGVAELHLWNFGDLGRDAVAALSRGANLPRLERLGLETPRRRDLCRAVEGLNQVPIGTETFRYAPQG